MVDKEKVAGQYAENLRLQEELRLQALRDQAIQTNTNESITEQVELVNSDNSSKFYYDIDGNLTKKRTIL